MAEVTTTGTWNLRKDYGGSFNRAHPDYRGEGTERFTWGTADDQKRETGVTFAGSSGEASLDGFEFTLGTVTYDNYLREDIRQKSFYSGQLELRVQLSVPGGPSAEIVFICHLQLTGDQSGNDPDVVGFPWLGQDNITIDGVEYAVAVVGFDQETGPPTRELVAPEDRTTTATMRAMLVRADGPDVVVRAVHAKGRTGRAQDDEYVEIVNRGAAMAPVGGWVLNAGDKGQDFTLPDRGLLLPGMAIRIYTSDQVQPPGWYGLTFNSKRSIWNDKGDVAELRDASGTVRSRYAYGDASPS